MPGRERVQFTKREDELLVQYLAVHNPSKDGRMGNAVYRQLEANTNEKWDWSSTHTWQSWRERYKKHEAEFDHKIRKYQKLKGISDKPASPSKQKAKQGKGKRKILDQDDDDDDDDEAEITDTATVTKRKRVSDVHEQELRRKKVKTKEPKRDLSMTKMEDEDNKNEPEIAPPPPSSDYSGEIFVEASNTDEDEDMIEVALADEDGEAESNSGLEVPQGHPPPSEHEQASPGQSSIQDKSSRDESILPPTLPLPTSTPESPPARSPGSTQLPPSDFQITQSDTITSQDQIHTRESRTKNSGNPASSPRPSFTRKVVRSKRTDDDIFASSPPPHDVHESDQESDEDASARRRRNQPPKIVEGAFGRRTIADSSPLPQKMQPSNKPVLSPVLTASSRNNSTQDVDVSLVAVQGSSQSRSTIVHSTPQQSSYTRKGKGQDMDVNTSVDMKGTRTREHHHPFSRPTQTQTQSTQLPGRRNRSSDDFSTVLHPQVLNGSNTDLTLRLSPREDRLGSAVNGSSPAMEGSRNLQNRTPNASSSAGLALKTKQLLDRLSISPRKGFPKPDLDAFEAETQSQPSPTRSLKHPFDDDSRSQLMSGTRTDRSRARSPPDNVQEPTRSAIFRSSGRERHPFEEDSQSQGINSPRSAGSVVSANDMGRSTRVSGDYHSARDRLIDLLLKTKSVSSDAVKFNRESSLVESPQEVANHSPRNQSPEKGGRTTNDAASPPSGTMEELTIAFLNRQKNHQLQTVQIKVEPEEPEVLLRSARTSEPRKSTSRARFADPVAPSPIRQRTATPPAPPPEPPPSRASRTLQLSSPQLPPNAVISSEANSPLDVVTRSRLSVPEAPMEVVSGVEKEERRRTWGGDSTREPRTGATPRIDLSARRKRVPFTSSKGIEPRNIGITLRASSISTGGRSVTTTTTRMSASDRLSGSSLDAFHPPIRRRSLLQTISASRSMNSPPLDFPISDTDRAYIMQHGIAMIIDGLADTHGFQPSVIWNVYKEMKDLPKTEAVLEQMRESADRSGVEAIRRISGIPVLENDQNDDEHSEDSDLALDRSFDMGDSKRRKSASWLRKERSRQVLKYQPADEQTVYSPHKMTRAAEWARLNGQGRTDEALLRESKRASLTASSHLRRLSGDVT